MRIMDMHSPFSVSPKKIVFCLTVYVINYIYVINPQYISLQYLIMSLMHNTQSLIRIYVIIVSNFVTIQA